MKNASDIFRDLPDGSEFVRGMSIKSLSKMIEAPQAALFDEIKQKLESRTNGDLCGFKLWCVTREQWDWESTNTEWRINLGRAKGFICILGKGESIEIAFEKLIENFFRYRDEKNAEKSTNEEIF